MVATERQSRILGGIIEEYIKSAQPVSSQMLERKHCLGICPATIRIEMQKLTEEGYISQPHISAGRIPTDKGYRYFVDTMMEELAAKNFFEKKLSEEFREMEKEECDILKFIQSITKTLSSISSGLSLIYLLEKDFVWRAGWKEVFREPEFQDFDYSFRFVKMVDSFEKEARKLVSNNLSKPRIYIGKENPIRSAKDFSMIIAKCSLPEMKEGGILAILGPKRMAYHKNINLINSVVELLKNY